MGSESDFANNTILVYNMTMSEDVQMSRLNINPDNFEHVLLVIVTNGSLPTHDDFYGNGTATVQLLICIEDGRIIQRIFNTTCDPPVMNPNIIVTWGFTFDGSRLTILAQNVAEQEQIFHVGSVVFARGAAPEKRTYVSTGRRRRTAEQQQSQSAFCTFPTASVR